MTAYTRMELLEIAAAHATGAASSEEELALHSAMQKDAELAGELELNRRVLEAMANAQAVAPSDLVRGRLLSQARGVPSLQLAGSTARRPMRNAVAMAATAAAMVAVLGLSAEIIRLRSQVSGITEFNAALQGQLREREALLNPLLMAENHLRVVHMLTSDTVAGPGIQLYWDRARATAMLHAFRLPPAPAGKQYVLWALGDGSPRSLFSFNSVPGGHVFIPKLQLPVGYRGIRSLAVTAEPVGGSAEPSSGEVVRAEVGNPCPVRQGNMRLASLSCDDVHSSR